MLERFEETFEEVMDELDMAWWEVYDSEIVETRIAEEFGEAVFDSKEYCDWTYEMAMDL